MTVFPRSSPLRLAGWLLLVAMVLLPFLEGWHLREHVVHDGPTVASHPLAGARGSTGHHHPHDADDCAICATIRVGAMEARIDSRAASLPFEVPARFVRPTDWSAPATPTLPRVICSRGPPAC